MVTLAGNFGTRVAAATVTLRLVDSNFSASVFTSSTGTFVFTHVPTDGKMIVTAFRADGGSGAVSGGLLPTAPVATANIVLNPPGHVNKNTFVNGDFEMGGFDGWQRSGTVSGVSKASVFPQTHTDAGTTPLSMTATASSHEYAALIGTNGTLSQTFSVDQAVSTLVGRVRFVSNEWLWWYGSKFDDTYLVTLSSPMLTDMLAGASLNTSLWSEDPGRFSGGTNEIHIVRDLSRFYGTVVTLRATAFNVGDGLIDSGLAVADFRGIRQPLASTQFPRRGDSGRLLSLRDSDWTKVLAGPETRSAPRIEEKAKTLKLWYGASAGTSG